MGGDHPSWDGRDTWTWGGVTHPGMAEIHGQGGNGMGHPSWDGRDTGDTMIGVVHPIL